MKSNCGKARMALYRRAGTGEADKRLRSKFREDRQMENVNNTARPSKEDEALFSDIARDIKANLDNYKEAGQWLDDNFGEAVRERLRQNKQKHGLAHCFNDAIGNTIGRPSDKPGTLQARLTQKEARRLLLIIWLLTDTADLTKTPKLTEFQLLPYEHDDCDVVVRDDDDYDDENKQRIYASVLGYIKSREYLFREFLEKNSEYNRLLNAARKAWGVLFGPRQAAGQAIQQSTPQLAQQPATPTTEQAQIGRDNSPGSALPAKPPKILQEIKWVGLYGWEHWKWIIVLIGLAVVYMTAQFVWTSVMCGKNDNITPTNTSQPTGLPKKTGRVINVPTGDGTENIAGDHAQKATETRRAVSRGLDGLWYCKAMAQPRPIYNQPDIRESGEDEPVFLCEGEKDCDAMESHGLLATTSSERD